MLMSLISTLVTVKIDKDKQLVILDEEHEVNIPTWIGYTQPLDCIRLFGNAEFDFCL